MALKKIKLGTLIEQTNNVNSNLLFGSKDVMGMTITKKIIPTKANVDNADLKKYLIVKPNEFIYNPRTHGKRIGLGFNNTEKSFLISWNNISFKIKDSQQDSIIPEYLFMIFNRDEWDRRACFDSWGSSTEVFSWDAMCDMDIELPNIEIQQKYVAIYKSLIANQDAYETGLEDLELIFNGYIENLKKNTNNVEIGQYLELRKEKNSDNSIKEVCGVSNSLKFINASSTVDKSNLGSYKIVEYQDIAYVPTTHMKIWASAISNSLTPFVISPIYEVFRVKNKKLLLPEYLFMWMSRKETIRYAYYNSWGSARENFVFDDLGTIKMPIPDISIQKSIVDIYQSYIERKEINERLKEIIKNACSILIKGSLLEAKEA